MTGREGLLPQRPCSPDCIEREVKDFPDQVAGENDAKIDPQG
jgi:hypothetical protein